jgi:hypothetical protein
MPTIDRELELTQASFHALGIDQDITHFTQRHWKHPLCADKVVRAMLLSPATPAHSATDLAIGLDWGKNRIGQTLSPVSPEAWLRLLRRPMRRKLKRILMNYHGPSASAATKSRYRITLVWDITTLLKVGKMLGLAGMFYSSMLGRPAHSIELVVLYAVIGEGWLCLPLDVRIRKPDPPKGHPCLTGIQLAAQMLEQLHRSLLSHFLRLEGHYLVADAWFDDGHLLRRAKQIGLIPIVQGKTSFVWEGSIKTEAFQGNAQQLLEQTNWNWKTSPQCPNIPYVRLTLKSPTFGEVVLILRKIPGEDKPDYLMCLDPSVTAPRILNAYRRRPWIEAFFEVCKATLSLEHFKFRSPSGIYGFIVLRFLAFVLFDYAARRVSHGKLTGGQIIRTLRYHGTLWLKQLLENKTLSLYQLPKTTAN